MNELSRSKEEPADNEKRKLERDQRREKKWMEMLKDWELRGDLTTKPKKLLERVWKGIPDALRTKVDFNALYNRKKHLITF